MADPLVVVSLSHDVAMWYSGFLSVRAKWLLCSLALFSLEQTWRTETVLQELNSTWIGKSMNRHNNKMGMERYTSFRKILIEELEIKETSEYSKQLRPCKPILKGWQSPKMSKPRKVGSKQPKPLLSKRHMFAQKFYLTPRTDQKLLENMEWTFWVTAVCSWSSADITQDVSRLQCSVYFTENMKKMLENILRIEKI